MLRDALAAGPAVKPGRARAPLELALRPPRRAWLPGAAMLLPCVLLCWQLQRQGAVLLPAGVALAGAAVAVGLWRLLRTAGGQIRRLRLCPDASVLLFRESAAQTAWLEPCSLRLGRHVLLVFRTGDGRRVRLLLGPGILPPPELAALGRWLQRAPGGEGTGTGVLR